MKRISVWLVALALAAGLATGADAQAPTQGGGIKGPVIVYIQPQVDELYHTKACPKLEPGAAPAKLQEVKTQGYKPCTVCKPPE